MHISVVIPTYNRSGLLARTIPALMNQQTEGFTYEVIFVSNGSTDNSDAILDEAAQQYQGKLRYFYIDPTGGPSAPRNVGIRAATGDVVIILDDDVLPENDLVLHHARHHQRFSQPEDAALGEVYVPAELSDDPMSLFHAFPYDEVRQLQRLSWLHFWTCNVSVKRQFMLDAGMFDESFLYYEDVLCGRRLADHGMYLRFVPEARGQHLHRLTPAGIPAKGHFTGRWLYTVVQRYSEPQVLRRFGVLSPVIGLGPFVRRLANRVASRVLWNPLGTACLRRLAGKRNRRDRITDLYYYLLFRQNMLAGYAAARREARAANRLTIDPGAAPWADRGEK